MYECMLKSENSKLSMLIRISQDDCRWILGRNVWQICTRWDVSEIELWQKWKLGRLSVFNTDKNEWMWMSDQNDQRIISRCKWFNESEIADFLSFIYTM